MADHLRSRLRFIFCTFLLCFLFVPLSAYASASCEVEGYLSAPQGDDDSPWLKQGKEPYCAFFADGNGLRAIRNKQLQNGRPTLARFEEEDITELQSCLDKKGFVGPRGSFLGFQVGWAQALCDCNSEVMGSLFTCQYFENRSDNEEEVYALDMSLEIYQAIQHAFSEDKECFVTASFGSRHKSNTHMVRVNGLSRLTNPGHPDTFGLGIQDPLAPSLPLGIGLTDGDSQVNDPIFCSADRQNSFKYWWEEDWGEIDLFTVFIKCVDQTPLAVNLD